MKGEDLCVGRLRARLVQARAIRVAKMIVKISLQTDFFSRSYFNDVASQNRNLELEGGIESAKQSEMRS